MVASYARERLEEVARQKAKSAATVSPTPDTSFVDFCNTVRKSHNPAQRSWAQERLEKVYQTEFTTYSAQVQKTALNESGGTVGGYLVPPDYSMRLMNVIGEHGLIYPRADVIPMVSKELSAPRIDVETASGTAGVPSFYGNMVFKWGNELAPAETEPTFRSLNLTAWDLVGFCRMSNDFLQDTGPAGEEALLNMIGKAASWFAEYAFFQGSGAGQLMPLGILNAPATLKFTAASVGTIGVADVATMAGALLPYSWDTGMAVWACSPTALTKIQQITQYYINTQFDWPTTSRGAHGQRRPCGFLSNLPLFVTDKLQPLAAGNVSLVLFDPSLYVVGNRQEVLIDVSEHSRFQNYQTEFRVWLRLDGKPRLSSTVTLQDQSTVVSPYVALVGK